MDILWAGWRAAYMEQVAEEPPAQACLFCHLPTLADDEALILRRTDHAYAVLNLYPYTNGHLMVVPHRHVANPGDLAPQERLEVWELLDECQRAGQATLAPHGFNIGANLGRAAGAGVLDHFHLHLVPRWGGDANFMTTTANTRVLPEALEVTWSRLRGALAEL